MSEFQVRTWQFDRRGVKVCPLRLGSWCKTCQKLGKREKHGYSQRKIRDRGKSVWENMTEEQKERQREYQRFWKGGSDPSLLMPVKERGYESVLSAQAKGNERLDVGPLKAYILDKGIVHVPGVSPGTISDIKRGEITVVSLDLADRVLTGMEEQYRLNDLYPI